jgi:hypothetical protein
MAGIDLRVHLLLNIKAVQVRILMIIIKIKEGH